METDIPHAILVDNVDNFVYNSILLDFPRFYNVDNFYTVFCVIHIFPQYSTEFVQFAKRPLFFDNFGQKKRVTVLQIA